MLLVASTLFITSQMTSVATGAMILSLLLPSLLLYASFSVNSSLINIGGLASDQLALSLIFLTLLITIFMLCSFSSQTKNLLSFFKMSSALATILIAVFLCPSLFTFYFLFESSLIPIFLMIMGWGYQPERMPAAMALLLYTIAGSLPLLFMILFLQENSVASFSCAYTIPCQGTTVENWVTMLLIVGFLIKFPMFLFHLWLPKAHVEAPMIGSMILAALLLKLGGYGLWRISYFCSSWNCFTLIQWIAMLGGGLIAILCLQQTDMKVLIAYSSVSHMSMVIACMASMTKMGFMSGFFLMIAHGVSSSAMFAGANYIYLLQHSRNMLLSSGMLAASPTLTLLWFLVCLGNMAAPPTVNLMGELWAISTLSGLGPHLIMSFAMISFFTVAYTLIVYASPHQGQTFNQTIAVNMKSIKPALMLAPHAWFLIFAVIMLI